MENRNWTTANIPDQTGKIILITGANSGLGLEAATVLSQKGATIVLTARNNEKGKTALAEIQKRNDRAKLDLMLLDLSDFNDIRRFSGEFHSKYNHLDILINNAGIMWPERREETRQGFEIQFGVNHLGHFALTGLLLDLLKKTPGSRIVTQSSIAHKMNATIHFDDLNFQKSYSKMEAYGQSKLANLLFTYELDRKLKEHKISTIAVASHPGITNTNLFRAAGSFVNMFNRLFAQKTDIGTLPMLRAATEDNLVGAEFFGPTKMMEVRGYPKLIKSNKKSYDTKLAKELWSVSEKLTGIEYNFN